ncbi:MAG: tetratricopeptide repeat protein [Bacteroidales bacterium]
MKSIYIIYTRFCICSIITLLSLPLLAQKSNNLPAIPKASLSSLKSDSLLKQLHSSTQVEEKLYCLFALIEEYQDNTKDIDYKKYVIEAQSLAKKLGDPYAITYTHYLLGGYYIIYFDIEQASKYLGLALFDIQKLESNKKNLELEIKINLALSAYYYYLSNLPKAIEKLNRVESLNTKLKSSYYGLVYSNNLAMIYKSLGENQQAITLFKGVLKHKSLPIERRQMTYANLASTYLNDQSYDSSIAYFRKALAISTQSRKNYSTANTLALLGAAYQGKQQYDSSLSCLNLAVTYAKKNKEDNILSEILVQMSDLYTKIKQYDQALKILTEGLSLAIANHNLASQCEGVHLRAKILYAKGKIAAAYQEQEKYQILLDSLNKNLNLKYSNSLIEQNKFALQQQQLEFEFKNEQLSLEYLHKIQKISLYVILLMLVSGIFITLILLKRKGIKLENKKLIEEALRNELEMKNKEFTSNLMFQMKRNEMLQEILCDLDNIGTNLNEAQKNKINALYTKLSKVASEDTWTDFEYQFKQVYQSFYDNLLAEFPDLTLSERKLCAFLKLNLTIKEIASIMNLDPNSVRVARVRLRKKIGLTNNEETLIHFLSKY